jgi:hypothetical protein
MHFIVKLFKTFKILYYLGMARTFGNYVHSGWDGETEYARYYWRGREWIIPTGPIGKAHRNLRWGFKSHNQLSLFLLWEERVDEFGEVEFASVIFDSRNWIGV